MQSKRWVLLFVIALFVAACGGGGDSGGEGGGGGGSDGECLTESITQTLSLSDFSAGSCEEAIVVIDDMSTWDCEMSADDRKTAVFTVNGEWTFNATATGFAPELFWQNSTCNV